MPILIVEFARAERARGKSLGDAALEGARLRLRPILMTSFAFILGCVPLWLAEGAGAVSRQIIGTAVIGGMLAASFIAIFLIPALGGRLSHRQFSDQVDHLHMCGRGLVAKLIKRVRLG
jgi:HAE1 family hydrophobic/amphiphilic exporter-1